MLLLCLWQNGDSTEEVSNGVVTEVGEGGGGTDEVDDGTDGVDDDTVEVDTVEVDGGTVEVDGGTDEVDGGTDEVDDGTDEVDDDTVEVDGGTDEVDFAFFTKQELTLLQYCSTKRLYPGVSSSPLPCS